MRGKRKPAAEQHDQRAGQERNRKQRVRELNGDQRACETEHTLGYAQDVGEVKSLIGLHDASKTGGENDNRDGSADGQEAIAAHLPEELEMKDMVNQNGGSKSGACQAPEATHSEHQYAGRKSERRNCVLLVQAKARATRLVSARSEAEIKEPEVSDGDPNDGEETETVGAKAMQQLGNCDGCHNKGQATAGNIPDCVPGNGSVSGGDLSSGEEFHVRANSGWGPYLLQL